MAQIAAARTLSSELQRALVGEPTMMAWIDDGRFVIGDYPNVTSTFDFGVERFVRSRPTIKEAPKKQTPFVGRYTGSVFLTILGDKHRFISRKALLVGALRMIEAARPGTLKELAKYKPRTKRIVAHKPELLYENSALAERYSMELMPGWSVATNNSTAEIDRYIRKAAELACLAWDRDISVDWG